ncbi:MAG: sirohydrochlorin cobaltochelatase [Lachnospiraceae bacterium]
MRKGSPVVSFGTSYEETRKKTIDQIENDMAEAFPSVCDLPCVDERHDPCEALA